MSRNYSNKNLTHLELGNIEFYLNQKNILMRKMIRCLMIAL